MSLRFDAEAHRYYLGDRELPSVTKVIGALKSPFDADTAAARVAARDGRQMGDVLAEWDAKRQRACDLGHLVHDCIESALRGSTMSGGPAEFRAWQDWWQGAGENLVPVKLEHPMGNAELGVAGTMDALFHSAKTGKKHVFDWKTNGRFETQSRYRECLLPPFGDLPSCELSLYSIQVSLYRLMVEIETGEECGNSWIVHLSPEKTTVHRAADYRRRVRDWLLRSTELPP